MESPPSGSTAQFTAADGDGRQSLSVTGTASPRTRPPGECSEVLATDPPQGLTVIAAHDDTVIESQCNRAVRKWHLCTVSEQQSKGEVYPLERLGVVVGVVGRAAAGPVRDHRVSAAGDNAAQCIGGAARRRYIVPSAVVREPVIQTTARTGLRRSDKPTRAIRRFPSAPV